MMKSITVSIVTVLVVLTGCGADDEKTIEDAIATTPETTTTASHTTPTAKTPDDTCIAKRPAYAEVPYMPNDYRERLNSWPIEVWDAAIEKCRSEAASSTVNKCTPTLEQQADMVIYFKNYCECAVTGLMSSVYYPYGSTPSLVAAWGKYCAYSTYVAP